MGTDREPGAKYVIDEAAEIPVVIAKAAVAPGSNGLTEWDDYSHVWDSKAKRFVRIETVGPTGKSGPIGNPGVPGISAEDAAKLGMHWEPECTPPYREIRVYADRITDAWGAQLNPDQLRTLSHFASSLRTATDTGRAFDRAMDPGRPEGSEL